MARKLQVMLYLTSFCFPLLILPGAGAIPSSVKKALATAASGPTDGGGVMTLAHLKEAVKTDSLEESSWVSDTLQALYDTFHLMKGAINLYYEEGVQQGGGKVASSACNLTKGLEDEEEVVPPAELIPTLVRHFDALTETMDPRGSSVEDLARTLRELQCIDDAFGRAWSGGDPGASMESSPLDDRVNRLLTEMEGRLYLTNMRLRLMEGLLPPLHILKDEDAENASLALRAELATTPAAPLDRSDLTHDELGSQIAEASGLLAGLRVEAAKTDETLAALRNSSATILAVKGTLAALLDLLAASVSSSEAESLWGIDISHGTYCGDVVKNGLVSRLATELLQDVVAAASDLMAVTEAAGIVAATKELNCRMEGANAFLASIMDLVTAEQQREIQGQMTATMESLLRVENAVADFLRQEEENGASIAHSLRHTGNRIHRLQTHYQKFGSSVVHALAAAYRKKKTVVKARSEIPLEDPCCD